MSDETSQPPTEIKVPVNLKWELAEDVPTIYANQLLVSHAGPEFYLIFGELVSINQDDPFAVPKSLSVKPRIRIAISRELMPAIANAINENLGNFISKVNAVLEHKDYDGDKS